MCGIAGQIGRDPRVIQGQYAAYCAMQQTLSRRGPDQRGMFISGRAALIHARLAVVDIENGLQPMQLDWQGETYVLVYNGELYNTPELRAALAQLHPQIFDVRVNNPFIPEKLIFPERLQKILPC